MAFACTKGEVDAGEPASAPDDGSDTEDTDVVDTDDTDLPADTDDTADTDTDEGVRPWEVPVDCAALLPAPVDYTRHDWVSGSEDFTFSAEGYVVQVTGGGLKRTPFGGPPELLVPLDADIRGTRFLPDGRIVLVDNPTGTLRAVDPATGSQVPIAVGLTNPNGIAIGFDGKVYVATAGRILRVDPVSGDVEIVADLPGNSFDGLTFSPDFRRLYFDEELGQIHFVDFDESGVPGEPQLGPRIPGLTILDGMATDACGNVYVVDMGGKIWRLRTDGTLEDIASLPGIGPIYPALNFGIAPIGGWEADKLYVLSFLGVLYALDIGVPGKWEPHLPYP